MMEPKTQTLYERVGGKHGVTILVEKFYDRVLADPELEPFFRDTPMEKLRAMQLELFAAALDGPAKYTGLPLFEAHRGRGIRPRHLTRFMDHLIATIEHVHPNREETNEMISRINLYSDSVIDGPTGSAE